eukprot:m.212239 g.212239  ORF g.212239 m.212239 type:complete len:221 (+) comp15074_c0_seq1:194-856(+)
METAAAADDASAMAVLYSEKVVTQYEGLMADEVKKYAADLSALLHDLVEGPVIDTSCGTGHLLMQLQSLEPTRTFYGIDIAPAMLESARTRLPDTVQLTAGDMRDLSQFEDNTFSCVLNTFALHHLGEQVEVAECFKEWCRVLKPNGRLYVGAWEGVGDMMDGGMAEMMETPIRAHFNRWAQQQFTAWASDAGLNITYERQAVEKDFGDENTYFFICSKA